MKKRLAFTSFVGALAALTSVACFGTMSQATRGPLPAHLAHLPVPSSNAGALQYAARLASEGQCPTSVEILDVLSPAWLASPDNGDAEAFLRAYCAFYYDGDLEAAEAAGLAIYRRGGLNADRGASLVSSARLHRCDLEGARTWLYRAQASTQPFVPRSALVASAGIEWRAGRADATRVALERYLEDYPADWFWTPASNPPAGVTYDRPALMVSHSEKRAISLVSLAAMGRLQVIPEADSEAIRRFVTKEWLPDSMLGPGYLERVGRGQIALSRLEFATTMLRAADLLRLDASQREGFLALADASAGELDALGDECADVGALAVERYEAATAPARPASTSGPLDTDRDGLPDAEDACPGEAEVFNGVDDGDGCPDEAIARIIERQIAIADYVRFETDSDVLLPESRRVLDGVAVIMRSYPQLRSVQIEGHTDSRGSDDYNLDLSQRRADTVRRYLESVGIESGRLSTRGFGEAIPLAFADNDWAWSINRRVEFTILDADPVYIVR